MKPETIEIVKSTAPVVKEHGKQIAERMYEIAFNERPEYRRFFEDTHMKSEAEGHKQAAKLAASFMPTLATLTSWKDWAMQ